MQKTGAILLILLLALPVMLIAQEDSDPDVEPDWGDYRNELYSRGDQTFMISLGVAFPTLWLNDGKIINHNITPPVGGTGTLALNYYFSSLFFIGGEIGGMFFTTLDASNLYTINLGFRWGLQFVIWKIEIPITLAVGMSWQTYLNSSYYGLYLKGGLSAYFRATNDWSFGLASNWVWMPEWTNEPRNNVDGNFVDLTLSARYHF
ncbi:MAG: hypothetical protein LBI28_01075 [Treponema sp.]|jgi:hypothetical protein|nr:hypothetical protein [Treponema sp.]